MKKKKTQKESNSIIGCQGFFGRKKIRVRVIPLDIKLNFPASASQWNLMIQPLFLALEKSPKDITCYKFTFMVQLIARSMLETAGTIFLEKKSFYICTENHSALRLEEFQSSALREIIRILAGFGYLLVIQHGQENEAFQQNKSDKM